MNKKIPDESGEGRAMATIKETKAGTYETTVYIGKDAKGKRKYRHLTARTKRELEALVREVKTAETAESVDTLSLTVGEAVDRYIAAREALKGDAALSPYSLLRNIGAIKNRPFSPLWRASGSKT